MGVDAVASFIQPRQETPSIVDTLVAMNPDARKQIIQSELYGKRFRPAADAWRVYKMLFGGNEERYFGAFYEHPWSQHAEKDLAPSGSLSDENLKARLEPRMYDKHTLVADASPFALAVNRATAKLELQQTHELRNDLSFPDQPLKGMNIILKGTYAGIRILQFDPGDSSRLYQQNPQKAVDTLIRLFNEKGKLSRERLLVLTDENYTILEIIDIQERVRHLSTPA